LKFIIKSIQAKLNISATTYIREISELVIN